MILLSHPYSSHGKKHMKKENQQTNNAAELPFVSIHSFQHIAV